VIIARSGKKRKSSDWSHSTIAWSHVLFQRSLFPEEYVSFLIPFWTSTADFIKKHVFELHPREEIHFKPCLLATVLLFLYSPNTSSGNVPPEIPIDPLDGHNHPDKCTLSIWNV
jgi:hypothetical protein